MIADDLRHAWRRLRAQPGTAAVAASMLALAIGVTSAMFTVVDHMLLRPVPFRDPSRLVTPSIGNDLNNFTRYVNADVIRAWRASPAFDDVLAFIQRGTDIEGESGLTSAAACWVTPGAFELLGVAPTLGRSFVKGEGRSGSADRVILADDLWRSDYASDPVIIGRRILVSGRPATVVGVMPAGFQFPYPGVQVWRPYDLDAPPPDVERLQRSLTAVARVAAGMPLPDAARLATMAAASVAPLEDGRHVILRGIAAGSLDSYSRTALVVLAAGVGLVFLVLCANVTNLTLARTTARRQEFGVCSALGASRGRLVGQVFVENVLLAIAASLAGLVLAWALLAVAKSTLPDSFLTRTLNPVEIDLRALVATSLVTVFAAMGAGLPAAWIGTSHNLVDSMRVSTRSGIQDRAGRRSTRALLVVEVALASALLAGTGVLVTSFVKLTSADSGMDVRGVTTAWITLPGFAFPDRESRSAFAAALQREVEALPGVEEEALSFGLPPAGGAIYEGTVETDVPGGPRPKLAVYHSYVGPAFFRVYGIPQVEGRTFQPGDGRDQTIVSEKLAQALWPGISPLGRTFRLDDGGGWHRVIGVSREVRSSPSGDPREDVPEFYTPLSLGSSEVMLGLKCAGGCSEPAIRDRVRAASPKAILFTVQPLEAAYREQFEVPRAAAGLAFGFALVSILAAAGGLFSVLSYAVGRRRREFGIRVAMGARPGQVGAIVLRESLAVSAVGLAAGACLAWPLSHVLGSLAFGVTASNPLVWGAALAVVIVAALLAAWRPAAHAMRADPVVLLRAE